MAAVFAACLRQRLPRDRNGSGVDAGMAGECQQEMLIAAYVIQDAEKEVRFTGGLANLTWSHTGQGQKTSQPLLVLGNEAKGLNGQDFCYFSGQRSLPKMGHLFAFP